MLTNETTKQQKHDAIEKEIIEYDAIVNEINVHVDDCTRRADIAFEEMEKMNASSEEFKEANRKFGFNYYIAGYLATIVQYAGKNGASLRTLENRLRFHAHAQRSKGELNDGTELSAWRRGAADFMEGIINKFFES